MMVLFRHDEQAQIIIHTANMIPQDWANLSQAAWSSPILPLLPPEKAADQNLAQGSSSASYGSGLRFKLDLLGYLKAYDNRRVICKPLVEELRKYDFSSIRGALVGHVPGRHHAENDNPTLFGWPAIRAILKTIPVLNGDKPEVVAQVSSIATLGVNDQWLQKTLFAALSASANSSSKPPKLGIVFPTPDEIRKSLDGYKSGCSIHVKIQTPAQAKQLQYLKPLLYHWAGDDRPAQPSTSSAASSTVREAGRKRAAPHIKTYIRYSDEAKTCIDWALVTSANLSKQAWGEGLNAAGDVRICSYELGVIVAPSMYGEDAVMVPTFQRDLPTEAVDGKIAIGCRMPYDLPLVRYGGAEEPWCATKAHEEPDWMGRSYGV
jgi:tyrosyl-DNA phosphodiesterase 1